MSMYNQRESDRIIFAESKHHKQILRSQIDPKLIDRIQIDRNPSLNYQNAYKSLFQDELQKTVNRQEEKKVKERILTEEDRLLYKEGMQMERPPMFDTTNMASSQLSRYGQRYVDYDEEKNMKNLDHIQKNYDGGQAFFKSHDQHLERKQQEAYITNKTLSNQLQFQQYAKTLEKEKRNSQNQAFRELKYRQSIEDQEKLKRDKMDQNMFRSVIVKQIEEEQERKNRKSPFEYQNIARHNPITNPIEYHIDNPYILKEIQNRNAYKNQSMYQNARY